jgi:hypothetical protein
MGLKTGRMLKFAMPNCGDRRQVYFKLVQLFLSNCRTRSKQDGRHLKKDMNNSAQSHVKKRLMAIAFASSALMSHGDSCTSLYLLPQ